MRVLAAIVFGLTAISAVTIATLALAGAPPSAYYWPPLVVGFGGLALGLVWLVILRDMRGLPVLLATLVAFGAIATAQKQTVAGAIILGVFTAWGLVWLPAGTRTRSYTTRAIIDRDRADVFSFVSDLRNVLGILDRAQLVEKLTEGPVGLGTRFRVQVQAGAIAFVDEDEIVSFEAPQRLGWRVEGNIRGTETLNLTEVGRATEVSHRWEAVASYADALLGMGLVTPLLNWAGARERRESWGRLKRVIETQA